MRFIIIALSFILCGTFTSCKDFLNLVPKNEKVVSTVEDVKVELLSYWVGTTYSTMPVPTYGQDMLTLPMFNDVNVHLSIYDDNLYLPTFKRHRDIDKKCMDAYYEDVDWKGLALSESLWKNCYISIGFMNTVIDDLKNVEASQKDFEQIDGEARVIRAWNIFKLLQFFAPYGNDKLGVPLNLDSENVTPSGRKTQTECYDIIEEELLRVLDYTAEGQKWNFFYSKAFIHSFLAEMYMFRAGSAAGKDTDWANAEKYSAEIVSNYKIEKSAEILTSLFHANIETYTRNHTYCALKLATERPFTIGNQFTGIWGRGNAQQVSPELWNLYDPNDIRLKAWFKTEETEGEVVNYVDKYKTDGGSRVPDIIILYRKADLFLINAEAKCHIGQEAEARQMLQEFRASRIPNYTNLPYENVLEEIYTERRRELCFENGSRWLDLKRLGKGFTRKGLDSETQETKDFELKNDDYRFALPIPTKIELDYNNLEQNPGWTDFN